MTALAEVLPLPVPIPTRHRPLGLVRGQRAKPERRPYTVSPRKKLSRVEIEEGIRLVDDMWYERPKTRADCLGAPRPCPFVSCRHHLYVEVRPRPDWSALVIQWPHVELVELGETCSLDVAEQGGLTLEEVGAVLNLTRERVRQIEVDALEHFAARFLAAAGRDAPDRAALVALRRIGRAS